MNRKLKRGSVCRTVGCSFFCDNESVSTVFPFFSPWPSASGRKGKERDKPCKKPLIPQMIGGLSSWGTSEHTGHSNTCNKQAWSCERTCPNPVGERVLSVHELHLFGFYSNNSVYTRTSLWRRILECKVIKPNPSGQSGCTPELLFR